MRKCIRTHKVHAMGIEKKLLLVFSFTAFISLCVTTYMNKNLNQALTEIEQAYITNEQLNEIQESLIGMQDNLKHYLDRKSREALLAYYDYEQIYKELIKTLNYTIRDNDTDIMEKNIHGLSNRYLELTTAAIQAKQEKNISKYKMDFDVAQQIHDYLCTYIFSLNNVRFEENSKKYNYLDEGLIFLFRINMVLSITTAFVNLLLLSLFLRQLIRPLLELSVAANRVAEGELNQEKLKIYSMDEVGIVTKAFNKMIISLQEYMEKLRGSIQKENEAKERELLMEANLKEAQLKYYQAQIHPHFLFNTLNAGVQMAMLEDAEKTGFFLQQLSELFRYSIRNQEQDVLLEEEIRLVDTYIYIMNVRYSGEIQYEKKISGQIASVHIPAMTIQPIVENAIRYGISEMLGEGQIRLEVEEQQDQYWIFVTDTGIGIEKEQLKEIRERRVRTKDWKKDSNGIGIGNVRERLQLYYRREDLFQIESEGTGKGTKVTIIIPKHRTGKKGEQKYVPDITSG